MVAEIDVEELAERIAQGATLIDVREVGEYHEGHVPGAHLFALSGLEQSVADIPDASPLLVICKSGARSLRAAEFLAVEGREALNVAGGTLAWIASGREVATGMERG